ncbi:macrosialin isoform X2 [Dasypus novemcinctus]|uniref:macrosialin isoform X2 n=1 Tax=Dasypus novemcinctus TaxID=9361 RepID=UPI00265FF726|nr:macrosialin isoform X2 [Dasypus novemcinctus]
MRLLVFFSGALLGLLTAQGTGKDCPHKKSATLLPSFTVTPTATESTASTATASHRTTKSHKTTSHKTTTHRTTTHQPTTHQSTTSPGPTNATHNPATTTSHGNATVHPTSNSTTSQGTTSTSSPHPRPPPPSPSPSPGSKEAVGDYTWLNGSQPCIRLQAQIQIRVLYPTQDGEEAWGISVLNPNKTKAEGECGGAHAHLLLTFPYGQLSFGFKQEPTQGTVYLNYMAMEYNVSFPRTTRFSCPSDQSILLPLIIGLTLLILLALVFVAFCIVRRRPSTYQPL